jgi:hypothetical protein
MYIGIFMVAAFVITPTENKCPQTEEWTNKLWNILQEYTICNEHE